jgi:hypothetical protein
MRAAAQRLPLALAARVDKRPKEEAAGLGGTYGESARPRVCVEEFGADGGSKRAGLRGCDGLIGSRFDGLLPDGFDRFAVLSLMWCKPMPSRNAVFFRVSPGRYEGRLVMLPAPAVAHGIWASGRGGRYR